MPFKSKSLVGVKERCDCQAVGGAGAYNRCFLFPDSKDFYFTLEEPRLIVFINTAGPAEMLRPCSTLKDKMNVMNSAIATKAQLG